MCGLHYYEACRISPDFEQVWLPCQSLHESKSKAFSKVKVKALAMTVGTGGSNQLMFLQLLNIMPKQIGIESVFAFKLLRDSILLNL